MKILTVEVDDVVYSVVEGEFGCKGCAFENDDGVSINCSVIGDCILSDGYILVNPQSISHRYEGGEDEPKNAKERGDD